jgi:hypothetical protein
LHGSSASISLTVNPDAVLARRLAARCRELGQHGRDAATAERLTFEEFLGDAHAPSPMLYQQFLDAYAPAQRRRVGVYYTPPEIVGVQVRLAAEVLEQRLGCRDGFGAEQVLVVDPATGSGAYPLAIAEMIGRPLARVRLFEPMVGAACIVRSHGFDVEERDALTDHVELEAPIVVCLGNPPYRRSRRCGGPGLGVGEFRGPDDGLHAKNLYNDYVYFWRWALSAVFEQRSGAGIVSFVTAASYLRGPSFGGMRQSLRRLLDDLWIVDLEGDLLAARRTENVFAIRTPVAIAMGVRYGESQSRKAARVFFTRVAGTRQEKLSRLARVRRLDDLAWEEASPGWATPLVAARDTDYAHWPRLTDIFPWQLSGAQLKRTWPIAPAPEVLCERWRRLLQLSPADRVAAFRESRDRTLDSAPPALDDPTRHLRPLRSLNAGEPCFEPVPYAYRSFDRQWVIPDARLGDFMRPALWGVAGPNQIFLTSLLTNVLGPGPAAVATALVPDLDHFRGSFGARAVIPLWRDAEATRSNVATGLLDRLAQQYGLDTPPEKMLAYCYALLATRSYVARFDEELRVPGPRVPFTSDGALFAQAANLGDRLLAMQTYRELPAGRVRCIAPLGDAYPGNFAFDPSTQTLRVGDGVFGPIEANVWGYSVSGLRPVQSWLRRRIAPRSGRSPLDAIHPRRWTPLMTRELLELVWVLEATLELEPALDAVLDEAASSNSADWLQLST